jgi:hypothetical protein
MDGRMGMAYETKVILALLAQQIGRSKTVKEAYTAVVRAANVEGVQLPTYEEFLRECEEEKGEI